ncbi:serine hydrolase domain-containing protein [Oscillospiraceae bacterium 44-5]
MSQRSLRLGPLLTALALLVTGCAPAASGSSEAGSSSQEEFPPAVSEVAMQDAVPAILPEPDPEPHPVLTQEDINDALARVMERYSATGVTVAAVECGQVSQAGAWGWAVKDKREMTPDTKIRIASISKVVIAMCAMAMSEDGLIDLDAPISDYWGPDAVNPYSKTQPTTRTFMTHTSSIKNLDITRGLSKLRGILQSKSSWRNIEPGNGTYWAYSNFGMCILGTTLELAGGQLLDDYLQARFLEPLGAKASFFGGRLKAEEVADLYSGGTVSRTAAAHAGQAIPTEIGRGASYFPGGYTTSAVDMAKLVAVLANDGVYKEPVYGYTEVTDAESGAQLVIAEPLEGRYQETRLLTEESVADMETPRFTVDLAEYSSFDQCLILRRQEDVLGQEVLYYHTGSAYGVYSLMTYNPETKNGVVVITTGARRNMNERGMYALCADLMELLYEKMGDQLV